MPLTPLQQVQEICKKKRIPIEVKPDLFGIMLKPNVWDWYMHLYGGYISFKHTLDLNTNKKLFTAQYKERKVKSFEKKFKIKVIN